MAQNVCQILLIVENIRSIVIKIQVGVHGRIMTFLPQSSVQQKCQSIHRIFVRQVLNFMRSIGQFGFQIVRGDSLMNFKEN